MRLKYLELSGFKSFAKKTKLEFDSPITAVVGPNGSGKSNVAEAFRWVLGEQSLKSLRGKRGEDLIFNGGGAGSRMNKATVSVVFDNSQKVFNIDYDEVIISRTVHRDGSNEYHINGSSVRLKDILELLANVSLGSSGHHIISQGEADRILNAGPKERREMIEEALGLKIYHWKISESEKKLTKTEDNIKQVESLRREIAPHIKFLKKQVEKIEQANDMRRELKGLYFNYFKIEESYLERIKKDLDNKKKEPTEKLTFVQSELSHFSETLNKEKGDGREGEIAEIEGRLRLTRNDKDELSRQIGRLEGIIEVRQEQKIEGSQDLNISFSEVENLTQNLEEKLSEAEITDDISAIRNVFMEARQIISTFLLKFKKAEIGSDQNRSDLEEAIAKKEQLLAEVTKLGEQEKLLMNTLNTIKNEIEKEKDKTIGAERKLYELRAQKSELQAVLDTIGAQVDKVNREEDDFKRELEEAKVLVDHEIERYSDFGEEVNFDEPRDMQEDRRRKIERLKIKLEDMGIEGTDVLEEYKETTKRDEYLAKELEDLYKGSEGLKKIMVDLREKLLSEFSEGIKKINTEFESFFGLMFGGGSAKLQVVQEEKRRRRSSEILETEMEMEDPQEVEEGIDISINLPRKKIRGLQMLSGGERALTSIALLFAMSQVNPPPFLILDETDAALDEANSRKYGDMIENLAKHSQLILITHNRETMSRAGVLYGVTMGGDSISKLLSIKFDQATSYAK